MQSLPALIQHLRHLQGRVEAYPDHAQAIDALAHAQRDMPHAPDVVMLQDTLLKCRATMAAHARALNRWVQFMSRDHSLTYRPGVAVIDDELIVLRALPNADERLDLQGCGAIAHLSNPIDEAVLIDTLLLAMGAKAP